MSAIDNACNICKVILNQPGKRMTDNCGGDCWGCIGLIECEAGCPDSQRKVQEEIKSGLRKPDGSPA